MAGGLGFLIDAGDQLADFLGCTVGALGQRAHFVGDHGKATALLAGPCGLDGGVEGEQVGLIGNGLDQIDNSADFADPALQQVDTLDAIDALHSHLFQGAGKAAEQLRGFGKYPAVFPQAQDFGLQALGLGDYAIASLLQGFFKTREIFMQLALITRVAVEGLLILLGLGVQLTQRLDLLLQSEFLLLQAACVYF